MESLGAANSIDKKTYAATDVASTFAGIASTDSFGAGARGAAAHAAGWTAAAGAPVESAGANDQHILKSQSACAN